MSLQRPMICEFDIYMHSLRYSVWDLAVDVECIICSK